MERKIRIGTRESQLALWQANEVKRLLEQRGYETELVYIKSEGDIDLVTPLYELGVQGIFTKALDTALLNDKIDIAVHSMKDVPVQPAMGVVQAAVLKRASHKDIFVPKDNSDFLDEINSNAVIATSSIRRKAQWLNRYPNHRIETLRGNVNTRLHKVANENWNGAIFAAAGLDRINLRPANAVELDWMLPAPAQGAIMVVCSEQDDYCLEACNSFNDAETALCAKIERAFLRTLLGGCSTPISALAEVMNGQLVFEGNMLTTDGKNKVNIRKEIPIKEAIDLGVALAKEILQNGGEEIIQQIRNAAK